MPAKDSLQSHWNSTKLNRYNRYGKYNNNDNNELRNLNEFRIWTRDKSRVLLYDFIEFLSDNFSWFHDYTTAK